MLFGLGMSITRLRAVRHRDFLNQSLLYGNRAFLIKPNDDVQAYMGCLRVAALNIIIAFMGNIGSECIIPGSVHIQPVQTGAQAACQFVVQVFVAWLVQKAKHVALVSFNPWLVEWVDPVQVAGDSN